MQNTYCNIKGRVLLLEGKIKSTVVQKEYIMLHDLNTINLARKIAAVLVAQGITRL